MKYVIMALWVVMSLVLVFKGIISPTEIYLGASMILAAEYVVEAKDK